MRLGKVKKIYPSDFLKEIEYSTSKQFVEDFKKTYYWEKLSDVIFNNSFYVIDFPKNKAKLRITFPLFLICLLFFNFLASMKWMFTGIYSFGENNYLVKKMIAWNRYCRFNIIN
jgi:hypothetical protein